MNLAVVFLTGLTTGGISCMAVQGGLLAGLLANLKSKQSPTESPRTVLVPIAFFLVAKLIAHILLGFLLGWVGSAITLSLTARLIFQALAAAFMFATAANLLQLHPIFRYVVFQPPKFLQRFVRSTSKSEEVFAPAILGVATIFIPCGITQAMEVLAIASGSPVQGALIMGAFTVGTMPIFAALGYVAQTLKSAWQERFAKIAATALVLMAVWSLNGVLVVIDSPVTVQRITRPITWFFSEERFAQPTSSVTQLASSQRATIIVSNSGYSPNYLSVQVNKPVQLTLESNETYSCALSFVLKEFNVSVDLKPTDSQTISFTPTKKGRYTYTCSMGMYSGTLDVI